MEYGIGDVLVLGKDFERTAMLGFSEGDKVVVLQVMDDAYNVRKISGGLFVGVVGYLFFGGGYARG